MKIRYGHLTNPTEKGLRNLFYSQSGQNVQVWTYARGGQGWVQRGSYPVTLANGDQLGAAATSGGQVRVYRNGVLLTTVDVSGWPYYQGGGYIGVWMVSAEDARLDDFGGGTLPTSLVPDRPRLAGLDLDGLKAWWDRAAGGVRAWWATLWGGGTYASLADVGAGLRLSAVEVRQIASPPAGQVWRSYYYAGAVRVAVRERDAAGSAVHYLLSDHLGSLSEVVTGASVSAARLYAIFFTWVSG